MKINYVPGLALRFFPGLTRDHYEGSVTKTVSGKIAIFSGNVPTAEEIWNIGDFDSYVTENNDRLVYQEDNTLQFTYDIKKQQRVIKRVQINAEQFYSSHTKVEQTPENEIQSPNSLFAIIKSSDTDASMNVAGKDLILLVTDISSDPDSTVSLMKHDFVEDEVNSFRHFSLSIFQGYQITDEVITAEIDDPENPGTTITVPTGTKKNIWYNKNWSNRISEAYRDCFKSNLSLNVTGLGTSILNYASTEYITLYNDFLIGSYQYGGNQYMRRYYPETETWGETINDSYMITAVSGWRYFYLMNQDALDLIDEINEKSLAGTIGTTNSEFFQLLDRDDTPLLDTTRFFMRNSVEDFGNYKGLYDSVNMVPTILINYLVYLIPTYNNADMNNSITLSFVQLMKELGFDEAKVISALRSIIKTDFSPNGLTTNYSVDDGVMTLQYESPIKLSTRFTASENNPDNKMMYFYLPRFHNRFYSNGDSFDTVYLRNSGSYSFKFVSASLNSTLFADTEKIVNGSNILDSDRKYFKDYTAISFGKTGNGQTDLEYDIVDKIDYVDSFTTIVKLPNNF